MFECLCNEKDGAVWRTVHIPLVTVGWAMDTLENLQKVSSFLPRENQIGFILDHRNTFIQIDNVGLIAVLPVPEKDSMLDVHITFWDGRLRGRENLCKTTASFVASLTRKRLITLIPEQKAVLLRFAKAAGFEEIGQMNNKKVLHFTNYRE